MIYWGFKMAPLLRLISSLEALAKVVILVRNKGYCYTRHHRFNRASENTDTRVHPRPVEFQALSVRHMENLLLQDYVDDRLLNFSDRYTFISDNYFYSLDFVFNC
jgi:hypothetical protein